MSDYKVTFPEITDRNEKASAIKRFDAYCHTYHITSHSDLELLKELIRKELLNESLWSDLKSQETLIKKAGQSFTPPTNLTKAINENTTQILEVKERLGLFEERKTESFVDFWKNLLQKINLYANSGENGVECVVKCPDDQCGKLFRIKKDIKGWDSVPHPFFREGNQIYSKKLFSLIDEKKITCEDVAEVLQTNSMYIDKIFKEIYLIEKQNLPEKGRE